MLIKYNFIYLFFYYNSKPIFARVFTYKVSTITEYKKVHAIEWERLEILGTGDRVIKPMTTLIYT